MQAGEQTLSLATFGTLSRAFGVLGLGGVDRLLGLRAAEVLTVPSHTGLSCTAQAAEYATIRIARAGSTVAKTHC